MKHLDLFSGIGGFALACEWAGIETIGFVEIDKFCYKVLKKHWPDVKIVEDVNNVEEIRRIIADSAIRRLQEQGLRCKDKQPTSEIKGNGQIQASLVTHAELCGCLHGQTEKQSAERRQQAQPDSESGCAPSLLSTHATRERLERRGQGDTTWLGANEFAPRTSLLLTAGFPCQPFSNAGRKRGASDDRYLWPQTLAVIKAVKPDWVLLENVAGILNMVFPNSAVGVASQASLFGGANDEICDYRTISGGIDSDLREAGYETVWLVIPACGVSAPHRRDRVWIVANRVSERRYAAEPITRSLKCSDGPSFTQGEGWQKEDSDVSDAQGVGLQGSLESSSSKRTQPGNEFTDGLCGAIPNWAENWYEVATRFCRMDARVSDRVERLKALGNAIVPAVAFQLIKAIKEVE